MNPLLITRKDIIERGIVDRPEVDRILWRIATDYNSFNDTDIDQ